MRSSLLVAPLLALAISACGTAPPHVAMPAPPSAPDRLIVVGTMQAAAAQVKRCYRQPRLPRVARQIATKLLVRLAPDGSLVDAPTVTRQLGVTPENAALAGAMARAAVAAVVSCAPLQLPAEHHQRVWAEFELTFSLGVSA